MISLNDYIDKTKILLLKEDTKSHFPDLVEDLINDCTEKTKMELLSRIKKEKDKNRCELNSDIVLWHYRLENLNDFSLRIGLYTAKNKKNKIKIIILIPEDFRYEYLSFLAHLSRFLKDSDAIKAFETRDIDQIIKSCQNFENE